MNLADAIRQAAQSSGTPLGPQSPDVVAVEATADVQQEISIVAKTSNANSDNPSVSNVVRLELVLNPEQLSSLLRAIGNVQHSVMTLREAATYLRLPSKDVEQMAAEGKLPALSIDGKWRFTLAALDEWMTARQGEETTYDRAVGA